MRALFAACAILVASGFIWGFEREALSIIAVAALVALTIGVLRLAGWLERATPAPDNFVRGRRLQNQLELAQHARRDLQRQSVPMQYSWGGVPLLPPEANRSFLAIGEQGSGKTILLRHLVRSVLRSLAAENRCVIFDIKGDWWRFIHEQCAAPGIFDPATDAILLHPYVPGTACWDIATDAGPSDVDAICAGLIPRDAKGDGRNAHFVQGARQLMGLAIAAFRELKSHWTLWDLLIACSSERNLLRLADASRLLGIRDRLQHQGDERGSVLSSLSTAVHHLRIPALFWLEEFIKVNCFSVSNWISGYGPRVVVLGNLDDKEDQYQPLLCGLLQTMMAKLLSLPEHEHAPRAWLFLDELPTVGRLESLVKFLNAGRSRGATAVLGTQSIAALKQSSLYSHDEADALIAAARNRAFLRVGDNGTAQWMAEQIGKREYYETGFSIQFSKHSSGSSHGTGTDLRIQERFVVHPDTFKQIPPPDSMTPLTAAFESLRGVWPYSMPPEDFPPRPTSGDPISRDESQIPNSMEWTDADLERLNLKGTGKSPPPSPSRGLFE